MARVKPLSDTQIKNLKPKEKVYKVADGDGLYLYVYPNGSKLWRLRITSGGNNTTKSLGAYPMIGLKEARISRDNIRRDIFMGINPFIKIKPKTIKTFGLLLEEYLAHHDHLSSQYITDQRNMCTKYVAPFIGSRDIATIETSDIVDILSNMNTLGVWSYAMKTGALLNRVFRYATTMQYIKTNPMSGIDISIIIKKREIKNYAHITDKNTLKNVLKKISEYTGSNSVKTALMVAPYVFVRPTNLRQMEWEEIDFEEKIWTIPKDKMKRPRDHIVPLTDRVIELLKTQLGNNSKYVFPSPQNKQKPLSENVLNKALDGMGFRDIIRMHGFRHTASTFLNENIHIHGVPEYVIEAQLAHKIKNKIQDTYNKAQYKLERVHLMNWWSNYIDSLIKVS